jgi:uncharacterized protein involved in exopolysaccharide biosynthesis
MKRAWGPRFATGVKTGARARKAFSLEQKNQKTLAVGARRRSLRDRPGKRLWFLLSTKHGFPPCQPAVPPPSPSRHTPPETSGFPPPPCLRKTNRGDQFLPSRESHLVTDLAYLLLRRSRRSAVVTILTIALALAYNVIHGPVYTASLRVLVSPNLGAAASVSSVDEAALILRDHGQTARNQAELLRDPGLIHRLAPGLRQLRGAAARSGGAALHSAWSHIAERLGFAPAVDPQEIFAARITRALTVTAVGDTDVVRLDFTWPDRHFAADALNTLLLGYQHAVAETAGARDALVRAKADLADAQAAVASVTARVDAAQAALAGLGSPDSIRAELEAARTAADELRLDRELARRKLDAADQAYRSGGWVDGPAAPGTPLLARNFAMLLGKRQEAAQASPANNAAVHKIDLQIKQVREQNYRAVRRAYSADLAALDTKLAAGQAAVASGEARQRAMDARRSELDVLVQARAAAASRVTEARRRAEQIQARIDSEWQEVSGTRVLSTVRPPTEPNWPAPDFVLQVAILAGVLAGLASAVLAERARRTIDRPVDIVRHLGVEVLARLDDLPVAHAP